MNRKEIVRRINYLLDHKCEPCPIRPRHIEGKTFDDTVCETCDVHKELRWLGDMLDEISRETRAEKIRKVINNKKDLTVSLYVKLSEQGIYDKDIAKLFGIPKFTLSNWKKMHKEVIDKMRGAKA